jgi:heme o synthase
VPEATAGAVPAESAARAGIAAPGGPLRASTVRRRSARAVGSALFALTKPRIIELLLVTTIPTMLLAERGLPSVRILLVTLVGGALAAGSANTINCYIDRDIDAVMRRTARRPLARPAPMAMVKPSEALIFGIVLGVASTVLLGTLVNWLSAVLADAAILFYVFIYTIGLKRRTASNIVIGGAAGCFPVLVGWSAVTGRVGLPAIVLFAVIFFWTPPHFWALAMKFRDDYAAASVPMLPVVAPASVVARKILIYSYVMVVSTLALAPYAGWLYAICAVGLGAWFLAEAHRLHARVARMSAPVPAVATATAGLAGREVDEGTCAGIARPSANPASMRLFHLSIAYLTLLFAVIAVVSLLPWGRW